MSSDNRDNGGFILIAFQLLRLFFLNSDVFAPSGVITAAFSYNPVPVTLPYLENRESNDQNSFNTHFQ